MKSLERGRSGNACHVPTVWPMQKSDKARRTTVVHYCKLIQVVTPVTAAVQDECIFTGTNQLRPWHLICSY